MNSLSRMVLYQSDVETQLFNWLNLFGLKLLLKIAELEIQLVCVPGYGIKELLQGVVTPIRAVLTPKIGHLDPIILMKWWSCFAFFRVKGQNVSAVKGSSSKSDG